MWCAYRYLQSSIEQNLIKGFLPLLQDFQLFFNEISWDRYFCVFLEEEIVMRYFLELH